MLAPVRQYALERLAEAGEVERLRDRHRDAYLAVAEQAVADAFGPGIGQQSVLAVLGREAANLRAAFDHALVTDGLLALRLAVAIAPWWRAHAHFQEAEDAFARALAAAPPERSSPRVQALSARAWVIANSGAHPRAMSYGQQALVEAEAIGDNLLLVGALLAMATAQVYSDPRAAVEALPGPRARARRGQRVGRRSVSDAHGDGGRVLQGPRSLLPAHRRPRRSARPARGSRDVGPLLGLGRRCRLRRRRCPAHPRSCQRAVDAGRAIDSPTQYYAAWSRRAYSTRRPGEPGPRSRICVQSSRSRRTGLSVTPWAVISRATAEERAETSRSRRPNSSPCWTIRPYTFDALVWATTTLAEVLRLRGDHRAGECARRGLELARSIDNRLRAAGNQLVLGRLAAAAVTGPTLSNSSMRR